MLTITLSLLALSTYLAIRSIRAELRIQRLIRDIRADQEANRQTALRIFKQLAK